MACKSCGGSSTPSYTGRATTNHEAPAQPYVSQEPETPMEWLASNGWTSVLIPRCATCATSREMTMWTKDGQNQWRVKTDRYGTRVEIIRKFDHMNEKIVFLGNLNNWRNGFDHWLPKN